MQEGVYVKFRRRQASQALTSNVAIVGLRVYFTLIVCVSWYLCVRVFVSFYVCVCVILCVQFESVCVVCKLLMLCIY